MTIAPRTLVLLCVASCVAGCQSTPQSVVQQQPFNLWSATLIGSWDLIDLAGVAVRPGSVSLDLQPNGRFVATVYCNYARGLYIVEGQSISFDGWDATERGCNEDMPQVDRIGAALRGDGYTVVLGMNGDLLLTGPAQLRLRRSPR